MTAIMMVLMVVHPEIMNQTKNKRKKPTTTRITMNNQQ
ncbi:unnamed protein product [Schistosoma curassoni]|uniref:Uncharacterized protein n=1 Tax=Schistosoma curassoni TaxID=6186 RepID=A0A183K2B5_9TREM|nr:unnamed protein product [Schistosoma curassoni]